MKKYILSLGVAITSMLSVFATPSNPYIGTAVQKPEYFGGRHQKIQ